MSGDRRHAKHAGGRPLDGGVGRHCGHSVRTSAPSSDEMRNSLKAYAYVHRMRCSACTASLEKRNPLNTTMVGVRVEKESEFNQYSPSPKASSRPCPARAVAIAA